MCARARTVRSSATKTAEQRIEEALATVDPLHAAVMVLGGTASACGITPPLTSLLMAFSGANGGAVSQTWHFLTTPGWMLLEEWHKQLTQETPPPKPKEAQRAELAAFCSGAVEAAIMYALVSNPETLKQILAIPGQAMQGAGKVLSVLR